MSSKVYKPDQVVAVINSVLSSMKGPERASYETIANELSQLKDFVSNIHAQLHNGTDDISHTHIPGAKDELHAVVDTTEQATITIMESCEGILEITKEGPAEQFKEIEPLIVKIFEACTFQDITGQRIKKVSDMLKKIDDKVASILQAMNGELSQGGDPSGVDEKVPSLLNGPALPQDAISQEDIDRLLADLDGGKA